MATATTPSRARPVLRIPGIENRSQFDLKTSSMSCGGLPTPPQSALESRRPSLQFSAIADYASSTGSAMGTFSQPATPIRGTGRHVESFGQSWHDNTPTGSSTTPNHASSYSATAFPPLPLLQPAFQPHHGYHSAEVEDMSSYEQSTMSHATGGYGTAIDTAGHGIWSSSHHSQSPLPVHTSAGLGSALFMSNVFDSGSGSHLESSMSTQQYAASSTGLHGYGPAPDSIYHQPQVVVPSQLSPHDDMIHEQYHALTSPHHAIQSYSSSFDSSTENLSDWDMVQGPAYFTQSDDEDYVHVVAEGTESPSYSASRRQPLGSRSKKRRTGRLRAANDANTYHHRIGNIEVSCTGFNPSDGRPIHESGPRKLHRCTVILDNGQQCTGAFARHVHLVRHAGKHSDVRRYTCPLPKCNKSIQRSDNAADHFKSHLRPDVKGRRNPLYDWSYVQHKIWSEFEDKVLAKKLLEKLQRWYDAGMPQPPSQARGMSR